MAASRVAAAARPFIGRERELDAFRTALSEALAGATRIVLVSGEAGIGKTELLERFRIEADRLGARSARAAGSRQGGAPAYWPWVQTLRQLEPTARSAHAGDPDEGVISLLAGTFDLKGDGSWEQSPAADQAFIPGDAMFRRFDAMTAFIEGASRDSGLVVVLDDVQHFDLASLRLLGHLVETLPDARLLIVVSFEEATPSRETSDVLSEMARARGSSWIRLEPLGEAETASLLASLTGRPVSAPVARRVTELAGGNPFFITELAFESRSRSIDEAVVAATATAASSVPERARSLIAQRVSHLTAEGRSILDLAAVAGPTFSSELVAQAAGLSSSRALELLGEAHRAGLVTALPERPGWFAFRHGLVRDALEMGLHPAARLHLHRRIGEVLERESARQPSGVPGAWAALAWHWHHAGDVARTVRYAALAGDDASRQLAFEEAARLYRLALDGSSIGSAPTLERASLALRLANAEYQLGEVASATEAIITGVDLARAAERLDLLAEAPFVLQDLGDPAVSANLLTTCETLLAGDLVPSDVRARLLAQRAVLLSESGRVAEAIVDSDRAMALAAGVDGPELPGWLLAARQLVLAGPEWPHERLHLAGRALDLARADASPPLEFAARIWRLDAYWELGDIPALEAELAMLDGLASRLRSPHISWNVSRARAALAMLRGRFGEALRLSEAATTDLPAGNFMARLLHVGFTGLIAAETGDARWLDGAGGIVERVPGILGRCLKARVLLAVGREPAARACFEQVRGQTDAVPHDARWMPAVALLADLASDLDDRATAQTCYRALAPFGDRLVASGGGTIACLGAVSYFLGRLASVLGRFDEAERWLGDAVARNGAAGALPWVAHSQLAMAEASRRRAGAARRGIELARQAQQTAFELGMHPLARRAQQRADTWSEEAGSAGGLSPREREIAALVAEGLTNRQIGDALFIAPRTAENHVQHILIKLSLHSRAEIAAWAVREDLARPGSK